MKFNAIDLKEASLAPGNQEGFLIHKPPAKTFDSASKERWFKLKGNLLFYYRLNGDGAVENNDPTGVFVLENFEVKRESSDFKHPFGFSITWKDDLYRKHCFYTRTESMLQNWMTNIFHSSYEMLRAELLVLRLKIRNKSGKDPLAHLGIPLHVHSLRGVLASSTKAVPLCRSSSSSKLSSSIDKEEGKLSVFQPSIIRPIRSAPPSPLNIKASQPLPPPRTHKNKKKALKFNGQNDEKFREGSFKCHLHKSVNDIETSSKRESSLTSSGSFKSHVAELKTSSNDEISKCSSGTFISHLTDPKISISNEILMRSSGSFKSHLTDTLSEDQLSWFLK